MPQNCIPRESMGLDFGLGLDCPKVNFRWLFMIDGISAVADALPPLKSSRPQFEFKEQQVPHLIQDIYYPIRPEWKPITLTLYDFKSNQNPVFDWMSMVYNPSGTARTSESRAEWSPVYSNLCGELCFKRNATLCLYDGCGQVIESWRYENVYPQAINWGELDMSSSEIVTVDVTLRYDRAYII